MKTINRLYAMLAAMLFAVLSAQADGYQMKIGFSGYADRMETLRDFPVLVVLSNGVNRSGFDFGATPFCTSSGYDLRFQDAAGADLDYEIESCDTNIACYAWVKVRELANDGTGSIWVRWGDPANASQLPCTTNGAVWANGFRSAWHLGRNGAGGLDLSDSTTNRYDGTNVGSTSGDGLVSYGASFASASSQYANIGVSSRFIPSNNAPLTVSCWMRPTSFSSTQYGNRLFSVAKSSSSSALILGVDASSTGKLFLFRNNVSGVGSALYSTRVLKTSCWYHVAATFNGSAYALFINGVQEASVADTLSAGSGTAISRIASGITAGTTTFNGRADEMEISSEARSADWIWASYLNQASNAVFNAYYGPMASGQDLWVDNADGAANITDTAADLTGSLQLFDDATEATVTAYWGTSDGGMDAGSWSNHVEVATCTSNQTLSTRLSGLMPGTAYAYRFFADTGSSSAWAPETSTFVTFTAPAVSNAGASSVTSTRAMLHGDLTAGSSAAVQVFWGTNALAWTSSTDLGVLAQGAFSVAISGLQPGQTYFSQCLASNAYGTAWSGVQTFVPSVAIYHVSKTGDDATGDGSTTAPWATIGQALSVTDAGDTIRIAGGTYTENVTMAGTRVSLRGGYDAAWNWDPANQASILFGNGSSPVVIADGAVSNTLDHLTLTGGTAAGNAGIQFTGLATYTFVEGCVISNNTYGVYTPVSKPQSMSLRNTLVVRNSSHGLFFNIGSYLPEGSVAYTCRVFNCTIADNGGCGVVPTSGAADKGGIFVMAVNTIFSGNNGYGIFNISRAGRGTISNCLFYANSNGPFYVTTTYWSPIGTYRISQGGNKTRDPRFVDAAHGDYRLQDDSPGVAAGQDLSALGVTTDILGVARPQGGTWDLGAYERAGSGEGALLDTAYVSTTGSDTAGTGSSAAPFASISHAVCQTGAGGTVRVAGGTYVDAVQFGPDKNAITVRGGYDGFWNWDPSSQTTIVDGNGSTPVSLCVAATSNTLSYLTLRGGTNAALYGGAAGAGIRLLGPWNTLFVEGCTVVSNTHGFYTTNYMPGTANFVNTVVARNTSHGIYFNVIPTMWTGGTPIMGYCRLYNCTVADNGGYGVYINAYTPTGWGDIIPVAMNTLFTGNAKGLVTSGPENTSLGAGFGYCLFSGNAINTSSYNANLTDLGNNLADAPPGYAGAGAHPYGILRTSAAVNSGDDLTALGVTLDILGTARPQNKFFDRGAYEIVLPPDASVISIR